MAKSFEKIIKNPKKLENSILNKLENILGKENVLTDIEDRYSYAYEPVTVCVNKIYLPDVVVLPSNTNQVSEILKLANENNIPIVARGAGTNHAGGCIPVNGGIVIHFSRINQILKIDKDNLVCKVQPGVVVEKLQLEVEKEGLFYPPDPSSLKVSTIGGSIAMSSSGPRTFKYGGTKDYVLDLEVVLADGSIIRTGASTVKNVTGYNLTQLFVGSEGTLGVVTEATLRLIPQPQAKKVLLIFFDSIDNAANAVTDIILCKLVPSTLDIMDQATLQTVESFCPSGLLTDMDAALVIEIDGFENSIETQLKQIIEICDKHKAVQIRTSRTKEEEEKIWTARRSAFGAVARLAPNVITEDMVVPRDKIPQMVKEITRVSEKYDLKVCIMGHIGDGNIHPNFSLNLRDESQAQRFEKAADELFAIAIEMGGTVSGEHGIGMSKSKYLQNALSDLSIHYMKGIKNLFDPKGILNPGKIFSLPKK